MCAKYLNVGRTMISSYYKEEKRGEGVETVEVEGFESIFDFTMKWCDFFKASAKTRNTPKNLINYLIHVCKIGTPRHVVDSFQGPPIKILQRVKNRVAINSDHQIRPSHRRVKLTEPRV